MKKLIVALLAGVILGAGVFWLWLEIKNQPSNFPIERAALPEKEEDLKLGEYFDLRGQKEVLVAIQESIFNPKVIIVNKGVKIFWKNEDKVSHSVALDIWSTPPRMLDSGQAISVVFDAPGFYVYHGDSEEMRGIIIVK